MARERDVNAPGGGHDLRNYWVKGPGAVEIGWGTDGSFARCVAKLSSKVKNPQGLCAEYHKAATGEWPAEKGVESSMDGMVEAHGTHNQRDHNPHKGFHVPDQDKMDRGLMKRGDADRDDENDDTRGDIDGDIDYGDDYIDEDDAEINALEQRLDALESKNSLTDAEVKEIQRLTDEIHNLRVNRPGKADEFAARSADVKKRRKKDEDDVDTYAAGDGDEPWEGILTVEGIESGDGRLFTYESLDWVTPPMPLMYQPANTGGHSGSILVGEIGSAARHGSRIRGKGAVFGSALAGPHGEDIRNMMKTGGVSVDVDKVKDADVEMVYADGDSGGMLAKPEMTIFHRGRIRGATLVAFPAFVEAKLSFTSDDPLTASCTTETCGCDSDDPLIASVHTITIPNLPKAEWFNEPTDVKLSGALTITDDGRVYGILAPGNTTHRNVKRKVPRGNVDYSRFHKAETIVEGGGRVVTGVITAACGHAPTENYGTLERRRQHYDNSCSVLANIRIGESRQGYVWAAGALNPGADPRQVAQALGCSLSGDWQPHPDRPGVQEFIAAHLVPVPGFPMARTQASVVYNDGVITASAIPIEHVSRPTYVTGPRYDDTFKAIQMTKRLLVASVGLDPKSRKNEIMRQLEMM